MLKRSPIGSGGIGARPPVATRMVESGARRERSERLDLVGGYFLTSGMVGISAAVYGILERVRGQGFPAAWGHAPVLSLELLVLGSCAWIAAGRGLLARRRWGGVLALVSLGVGSVGWELAPNRRLGELAFMLVGLALTVSIWKELDVRDAIERDP